MTSPAGSRVGIALLALAALLLVNSAHAATVSLAPVKDNTLIETPIGASNGAGDGIYAGRVGVGGGSTKRRGLLAFNLSSIPAGSTITAVTLGLEMSMSPNGVARAISLHRVSADWGEAGSVGLGTGSPAQPGDATWLFRFFNTTSWTAAGGDFAAANSASQSVLDLGPYVWTDPGLVADVQFWLDHAASNFGWLLLGDESVSRTVKKFDSREGATPPRLTVDYTPPTGAVVQGSSAEGVSFAAPWPTPASGPVNLSYSLPRSARVSLVIEDAMGRTIRRISSNAEEAAGRHSGVWDGRSNDGTLAAPGIYLASLRVDGALYHRRIAVLH